MPRFLRILISLFLLSTLFTGCKVGFDDPLQLTDVVSQTVQPRLLTLVRDLSYATPTSSNTVKFIATFDRPVLNVTQSKFATTTTGTLSATVSSISTTDNTSFEITVTLSGDGTVRVDLYDPSQVIKDANGLTLNPSTQSGDELFTIDQSAAPVTGFTLVSPLTSLSFDQTPTITVNSIEPGSTVVFTSDSSCLAPFDFAYVSGTSTTVTLPVAPALNPLYPAPPAITATPLLAEGAHTIYAYQIDPYGNRSACSTEYLSYTVDITPPVVQYISPATPVTDATNASSMSYLVTFSEDVTGVDATDFQLTVVSGTEAGTATISGFTALSARIYRVDVTGISFTSSSGQLRVDLNDSTFSIQDTALNTIVSNTFTTGDAVTFDQVTVTPTIALSTPVASPANADSATFLLSNMEVGSTYTVYDSADCDTSGTAVATGTLTGTATTALVTFGRYVVDPLNVSKTFTYTVKHVDPYGNSSACSSTVPSVASYQYDDLLTDTQVMATVTPAAGELFGSSADFDFDGVNYTMVVGAPNTVTDRPVVGVVYATRCTGGDPTTSCTTSTIKADVSLFTAEPNGSVNAQFGAAVAVKGDFIVATAPMTTISPYTETGAMILYQIDGGGNWIEQQEITSDPADMATGDHFGQSVDIDINVDGLTKSVILVGAPNYNSGRGKVYLFEFDSSAATTAAVQQQVIKNDTGTTYDSFGFSVAIDKEDILVGRPGADSGSYTNVGSATFMSYNVGDLTIAPKQLVFNPSTADATDKQFGYSVALVSNGASDASYGVVGEPGANLDAGKAWYLEFDNRNTAALDPLLTYSTSFTQPSAVAGSRFGQDVSIDSSFNIVASAPIASEEYYSQGKYVFFANSGVRTWLSGVENTPDVPATSTRYGSTVNVIGNYILTTESNFSYAGKAAITTYNSANLH